MYLAGITSTQQGLTSNNRLPYEVENDVPSEEPTWFVCKMGVSRRGVIRVHAYLFDVNF